MTPDVASFAVGAPVSEGYLDVSDGDADLSIDWPLAFF